MNEEVETAANKKNEAGPRKEFEPVVTSIIHHEERPSCFEQQR